MRILVTGGSGFIGSHVVDVLSARGFTPVIFDRVPSPHHGPDAVEAVLGELADVAALERALRGCDAVVHLAAVADVNDVQADPEMAEHVNSSGTLAVLEAARRAGVGRVVYGSTIWVYSDCDESVVDEDTRLVPPRHLYTATKLAGELYCRSYAELYGVDCTVLRFGIPYGPRARPATVLALFVEKALRGEPLTVAGSGSQSRRFVYVEDLADGVVRALRPQAAGRVYNLAGDETVSILEIAQAVRDLVGDTEIVHTPGRAGDFDGKEVSSVRAAAELGWEPATPFAEGARRYVEWRRATGAPAPAPAAPRRRPRVALPAFGRAVARLGAAVSAPLALLGMRAPAGTALTPPLRRGRVRPLLSATFVAAAFVWSFATDDSFSLLARAFGTTPQTHVATTRPDVGLLIKAPPQVAPQVATYLAGDGDRASFALEHPTGGSALAAIRSAGSDAMPQLRPGGLVRWLGTASQLHHCAHGLGVSGHVYYALPGKGFTFGQDVIGNTAGATPVQGAVKLDARSERGLMRRGVVVEVSLVGNGSDWRPLVARLVRELHGHGLAAVPADSLLRAGRDRD